ncbi:MAG: hypothetical protein WDO13_07865 [Verrucomicrobiota bacterium]
MGVHQNQLDAAVMENGAAKVLAAVEPDEVFLEAEPVFATGALFLRDDGSPAGLAESFDHGGGGKEAVAAAGPGMGLVGVGGGHLPGEIVAGEFVLGTTIGEVGGSEVVFGGHHGGSGLWLRPALTFEFYCLAKDLIATLYTYHSK